MSSRQPFRDIPEYLAFLRSEIEQLKRQQGNLFFESTTVGGSGAFEENPIFDSAKIVAEAPYMDDADIYDCLAKWDGEGNWAPDAFPETTGLLTFSDSLTQNYVNLFLIISAETEDHADMPLLVCDQGMLVKKDFALGGYLSIGQGAIYMGSRMQGAGDPPKIVLSHSGDGYDTLFLKKFDGSGGNFGCATISLDSPTQPLLNFKLDSVQKGSIYHDASNLVLSSQTGGISFASATGYLDPYAAGYKLGYYTAFADIYATNLHGALTDVQALSVLPRGTSGKFLRANGAGSAPSWEDVPEFDVYWDDILSKPSTFAPSSHAASHAYGGGDQVLPQGIGTSSQPTFAGLYIGSAYMQYIATSPAHLYINTSLDLNGDLNADHVSADTTLGAGEFLNLGSATFQYISASPAHVYLNSNFQCSDLNASNASITNKMYAGDWEFYGAWNNAISIPFSNDGGSTWYTITLYLKYGVITNVTVT